MGAVDDFLQANEQYAAAFDKGDLPAVPARRVAVVTCMDARMDPARFLGLHEGDAHVIRNAGGSAVEALRSLVISQHLLGTREIAVIHHTACGMLGLDDAQLRRTLRDNLGVETEMDFLPFADLEQSVRDDVAFLRASPLLLKETLVRGFIYDVGTGRLHEVR